MKQQSLKLGIAFVVVERAKCQLLKNRPVIFLLQRVCNHLLRIHRVTRASLMVENCRIKFFLGSEMPEYHRFRNAGRLGDLAGSGAAKATLRKEADGDAKDLQFSVL